jgi:hypothetical protein
MSAKYNPSVHQAPRYQPIPVTPPSSQESLLHWLRRTGRLKPRQADAHPDSQILEELEEIIDSEDYSLEDSEEEE